MASAKRGGGGKSSQVLPKRLQSVFDKSVLKLYEQEKFENAISEADRILKEVPDHGETLVMKGLCLTTMAVGIRQGDKPPSGSNKRKGDCSLLPPLVTQEMKEELFARGMSLVQSGLSKNMQSSMCWRVKGVAHKSLGEYHKALACYKQALKCRGSVADKNTRHRILAEMCSLQISLHLWKDLSETRNELYLMNPTDKSSALQHLCCLFQACLYDDCYQFIMNSVLGSHTLSPLAYSDCLLICARCLLCDGKYPECLSFLLKNEKSLLLIKDRLAYLRIQLAVYRKQGDFPGQRSTLLSMIELNPEHSGRIRELLRLVGFYSFVTDDDSGSLSLSSSVNYDAFDEAMSVLDEVQSLSGDRPSSAVARIKLDVTPARNESEQSQFRLLIHCYLRKKLMRSVMSLYKDIKELYNDEGKAAVIDDLCDEYLKNLQDNNKCKFLDSDVDCSASPSCLIWLYYLLTNRRLDCNDFQSALNYCNQALELCPTSPDLYDLKGRVFKYGGNPSEAFKWLNQGRELDLADRFINTKCVRYALRCHEYEQAQQMVHLFTKRSEGQRVLHTLQVNWFELAKAECHDELDEYGPGLRYYECVYDHFVKFHDNSLYFNRYAARSDFPLTCLQSLKWDCTLSSHPFYKRAIRGSVLLWLRLLKCKQDFPEDEDRWCKGSSPMDRNDEKLKTIEDPRGYEFVYLKDPLSECDKFVEMAMVVEYENNNGRVFNLFTQTLNIMVNGHSDWFANDERHLLSKKLREDYPLYRMPNQFRERRAFGSIVNGCLELSNRLKQRSNNNTSDPSSAAVPTVKDLDPFADSDSSSMKKNKMSLMEDDYDIDQTLSRSDESDFIVASVECVYRMDCLLNDEYESRIGEVSLKQTKPFTVDENEDCRPYSISTLPLAKQALFNLCSDDGSSDAELLSDEVKTAQSLVKMIQGYLQNYCEQMSEYCAVYRSLNLLSKDSSVDTGLCSTMMKQSVKSMIECVSEASLKECISCFRYVRSISADDATLISQACKSKYPLSTVFDDVSTTKDHPDPKGNRDNKREGNTMK